MTTSTNNVTKYLKFANVQMAAESLFGLDPAGASPTDKVLSIPEGALTNGNLCASKFTPTQAAEFLNNWQVVEHKANTKTGFSGTRTPGVKLFCAVPT